MSEESLRIFLCSRLEAQMTAYDPAIRINYPNQPFPTPIGEVYGQMHILNGRGLNIGKSGEQIIIRKTGVMQVTFYSPEERGTSKATKAIDAIVHAFENYQARDGDGVVVTCKVCMTHFTPPAAGWFQSIVRVPFYRDEYSEINSAT
jgi:hypothetical protein